MRVEVDWGLGSGRSRRRKRSSDKMAMIQLAEGSAFELISVLPTIRGRFFPQFLMWDLKYIGRGWVTGWGDGWVILAGKCSLSWFHPANSDFPLEKRKKIGKIELPLGEVELLKFKWVIIFHFNGLGSRKSSTQVCTLDWMIDGMLR